MSVPDEPQLEILFTQKKKKTVQRKKVLENDNLLVTTYNLAN